MQDVLGKKVGIFIKLGLAILLFSQLVAVDYESKLKHSKTAKLFTSNKNNTISLCLLFSS